MIFRDTLHFVLFPNVLNTISGFSQVYHVKTSADIRKSVSEIIILTLHRSRSTRGISMLKFESTTNCAMFVENKSKDVTSVDRREMLQE